MNVYCACIYRRRLETVLGHTDKTCSSAATNSWELSFCSRFFLYTNMKTLETDMDLSERRKSFATTINILKIWKGFSCAECSVVEPPRERVWNEIEELKTTRQIYTDSSVMIVTPCGTYGRLGSWKLCFFAPLADRVYFGNLCFEGLYNMQIAEGTFIFLKALAWWSRNVLFSWENWTFSIISGHIWCAKGLKIRNELSG